MKPNSKDECPNNMEDRGSSCAKLKNNRGAGSIPECNPDDDADAESFSCYPKCDANFTGVGPVCW